MIVEMQIGKLAKYIEEFTNTSLIDNQEVSVEEFGIYVPALDKKAKVNQFIKKFALPMIWLEFDNGYSIRVAKKHILQQNGNDIFAKDLKVGSTVDHLAGNICVVKITKTPDENCFDLSIDAPYLYYDANGLVHHNTIMTASLSERVQQYGRSIIIVPSKSLVIQTEKDYNNMGLDVGVFFGDRKDFDKTHTICTWQSLNALLKNTTNHTAEITIHEFLDGVICVIADEVHGAKAEALKTLLTTVLAHVPIRWGLTGTIPKSMFDFQPLHVSFGPVMSRLSASELQDQGVLAQCHVNIVQLVDHAEYKDYQSELKYLLEDPGRTSTIANLVKNISKTGNTLVLVDRVGCGKQIAAEIGDSAIFLSGATKVKDRQEQYDEVADTTDKIIVATYGIAAVGLNIVKLHNVVLLEPGKSFVRVIQSIGRGLRKGGDKDFVNIYDITSTCKFAKRHLTKRKQYYAESKYPFTLEKLDWK